MRVNFQTSVYVLSTKGCPKKVCKPCIFTIFSEIHSQVSMEKWFLNYDKDLYEKYQNLKFGYYLKLER